MCLGIGTPLVAYQPLPMLAMSKPYITGYKTFYWNWLFQGNWFMNKYLAIELAIVCKHIGTIVIIILYYNTVLQCTFKWNNLILLWTTCYFTLVFLFAICASHGLLLCVIVTIHLSIDWYIDRWIVYIYIYIYTGYIYWIYIYIYIYIIIYSFICISKVQMAF